MAGILDRLNRNLGQPGMGQALGLLGAHLMAAGAPSFNPGGRAEMIPRGAGAFSDVLRRTAQDAETKRFRDQQIAQMEQLQAERERKAEGEMAMQRMLLGGQMGGQGAPAGSFRGAQDVGTEAVSPPILTDPLLMGMAKANPMAAAGAKLRQDQAEAQFGRQKELKGMPLSPEQEAQRMRMAGAKATGFEKKVAALIASGVDRQRALGIAAGRYRTSVNPADGSRVVIDLAQNGAQVGPPIPPKPKTPAPTPPKAASVEQGIGMEGFLKSDIANTITDFFGAGIFFPEAEEAVSSLKRLQVITETTLQGAVPGRPSNYLLQRLSKMTVTPASWRQGEERAKINMKETRDLIADSVGTIQQYLDQPLKAATRQKWDLKRRQLKQLQDKYDEILGGFGGGTGGGTISPERERELLEKYR